MSFIYGLSQFEINNSNEMIKVFVIFIPMDKD